MSTPNVNTNNQNPISIHIQIMSPIFSTDIRYNIQRGDKTVAIANDADINATTEQIAI